MIYFIYICRNKKTNEMKTQYIRVSTLEQNTDRQELKEGFNHFIDKCSGSISFKERKEGKRLINLVNSNAGVTELHIHSIDRLGRSTLDIMQTIEFFTSKGVNVISTKEGLQTLINGKPNPIAKMLVGILGTLAEFELNRSKERQAEGIAKAKAKGRYKGRSFGTGESTESLLAKTKNDYIVNLLKKGYSNNMVKMMTKDKFGKCSINTVSKVKSLM